MVYDLKVLLIVLIAVLAMGFRVELGPAKVASAKDPVSVVVARKMAQTKKAARAAARAAAGGAGAAAAGPDAIGAAAIDVDDPSLTPEQKVEIKKKARAAGGDIDESTERALRELEDHGDQVAKKLKTLPGAGGSEDEDDDEEPAK